MKKKCVLAVVVTYNRLEMLKQCVESIEKQDCHCDLLIVDNASTDQTRAFSENKMCKSFHYLRMPRNTGGAGGFNAGIRWGAERGYDFLWLMDDDTIPHVDALRTLLAADATLDGSYGFLASTAQWVDGTPCRMNVLHPIRRLCMPNQEAQGLYRIEQATFVSCLFPIEVVKKYGLPIQDFFIWGDDMEYTRRIAVRGGEPCYWVRDSVVIHAMANNNGSMIASDSEERLDRYRFAYRNEHYFYRKEGLRGFLHYTARCGMHIFRVLAYAKSKRLLRISIILKAYFTGFSFNPEVEMIVPR